MENDEVIAVLANAVFLQAYYRGRDRMDGAGAMGVVQSIWDSKEEKEKKYVIKFILDAEGGIAKWAIIPTTSTQCKCGDIIHYHETDEDVVTKAALFGDKVMDSEEDV